MKYFFMVFLCLVLFGCTSPSPSQNLIADLRSTGMEKFGHNQFVVVVIPGSHGSANDATQSGLSAVFGPSKLVRSMASTLKDAHSKHLDVLFYGNTTAKTEKTVRESLKMLPTGSLSGMHIYVGEDIHGINDQAKRVGAKLIGSDN